jgi:hypothetical protein
MSGHTCCLHGSNVFIASLGVPGLSASYIYPVFHQPRFLLTSKPLSKSTTCFFRKSLLWTQSQWMKSADFLPVLTYPLLLLAGRSGRDILIIEQWGNGPRTC